MLVNKTRSQLKQVESVAYKLSKVKWRINKSLSLILSEISLIKIFISDKREGGYYQCGYTKSNADGLYQKFNNNNSFLLIGCLFTASEIQRNQCWNLGDSFVTSPLHHTRTSSLNPLQPELSYRPKLGQRENDCASDFNPCIYS